jgi:hypothetical protein
VTTWILILTFVIPGDAVSVTPIPAFATKQDCMAAADVWIRRNARHNRFHNLNAVCVSSGDYLKLLK